jgi:hypothetical protein
MKTTENVRASDSAILIQLHIAEYAALTTRASYWMVMQFGLLTAAPAIPVLGVYLHQMMSSAKAKSLVAWTTFVVLQVVGMLWANMMLEQFALVKYTECLLRRRIEALCQSADFWLYEPYLVRHRPVNPRWGNYCMVGAAIFVLAAFVLARFSTFSRWDALGLIANMICMAILFLMSKQIAAIQRSWAECDQHLLPLVE